MTSKLNDEQKKALTEMKDSRAIKPKLLNAFADEKGALYSFLEFALKKDELNICFRGNKDSIEIYYLNHVVWELASAKNGCYKVSFNFNHAKKMCERDCYLKKLTKKGFELKKDGIIVWTKSSFSEKDIDEELWCIFKEIMDSYFNPNKGKPNIEKRWQHKIFKDFHKEGHLNKDLYVYDLEYNQKLPHKDELIKIFGEKTDDELKEMCDTNGYEIITC